jgi:hypothetical protein
MTTGIARDDLSVRSLIITGFNVSTQFLENQTIIKTNKMKKLKLIVIGMVLLFAIEVQAQVGVTVNMGSPPAWGPAGYTTVSYYYLPDVEAFYDVPSSMFIYYTGGIWVHKANLPARFSNYDLYGGYKVVMTDYHGKTPYTYFKEYKIKYAKGYHGQPQKTIGVKPAKANNNIKMPVKGNSNNGISPGNSKSAGHGNGKSMKNGQGHGGGNGKKK